MLLSLHIQNFAIIKDVKLDFNKGLHVITGETGAGKSIMLDALGLVLGERAKNISTVDDSKTVVEAEFDISKLKLQPLFKEVDIEYHNTAIIRREILVNGRSRTFVNDTPTQLQFLSKLAEHLIEVHQQFDQLALRESLFQYDVLDVLGNQKDAITEFGKLYKSWLSDQRLLSEKKEAVRLLKAEQDFLQYQFDELSQADINPVHDDELDKMQTLLSQAEDIQKVLHEAEQLLQGEEQSTLDQIQNIINSLSSFSSINEIGDVIERLDTVRTELNDIAQTIVDVQSNVEHDPQKLTEVEERLSLLFRLKKKHNIDDAQGLLDKQAEVDEKLSNINSSDQELTELENIISSTKVALEKLAIKISNQRKKIIPDFEKNVQALLKGLGMPNATIKVELSPSDLHEMGVDNVQFLFSSNKGVKPSPIKLTASGGEISRLNLAIKSEVAGEMALPTIIFDEIDSGVSGEVARNIGSLLEKLSTKHQIICITHTPQIASANAKHFHVSKDSSGKRSHTIVEELDPDERTQILAEMLDGSPPSKEALENAMVLLK